MPENSIEAARPRAKIDLHVAAHGPAHVLEPLDECCVSFLSIPFDSAAREHNNTPCPLALLRARHERPRRRAGQQSDEPAPTAHSIASSASASRLAGTSRPSVLAVCRLMTNSNLVARTIGRSAGFSPLRMRPV